MELFRGQTSQHTVRAISAPISSNVVPVNLQNTIIEKAIRESLNKPTGELTKADLEKVTRLDLEGNKLTEVPKGLEKLKQLTFLRLEGNKLSDVKTLAKLTQLKMLWLTGNQAITKAQIAELQKALPKCKIQHHTATK